MPTEAPEPQEDDSRQLGLYLEGAPDDRTLERMRQVAGSPAENPFEAELPTADLAQLAAHGEEMKKVLETGVRKIREELERRGEAKLAEVKGCSTYGRTQILSGTGMKTFNIGANEREAFYVGMDIRIESASGYDRNYLNMVHVFAEKIQRDYPGYLVTWDGKSDHPVNLWVPISKL